LADNSIVYFISDVHLGIDTDLSSLEREELLIEWLRYASADATDIYIIGDLFDYWYEYRSVVPKGYFRLFTALHDIVKSGVTINYVLGNHDLWHRTYLARYVGLNVIYGPISRQYNGKIFFIAHGDGLGPGDRKYKFIKAILRNRFFQFLFSTIHPTVGLKLMKYMSKKSRQKHDRNEHSNDRQLSYSRHKLTKEPSIDYFIMGHQHLPKVEVLQGKSTYVNLGDWTKYYTYARWDGLKLEMKEWNRDKKITY